MTVDGASTCWNSNLATIFDKFRQAVLRGAMACLCWCLCWGHSTWAEELPTFFRGLNLNGPEVTIDGHPWLGSQSSCYVCNDKAFENQKVPLVPPTDPQRAEMLRSSRWGGNRLELLDVPSGTYTLFIYAWEDNNPEIYSVSLNGRQVLANHNSGAQGHWDRLGPFFVSPQDGKIVVTSVGGAANFSGIELWRGRYDGLAQPLSEEQLAFFEKRIRPLLVEHCYECHSQQSPELGGDLLVDSRGTLLRGGTQGPAIVPGNLDKSLLIEAVRYDKELQMPPSGKLSPSEIADLERWVEWGAPDPRTTVTQHAGKQIDLTAAREFWSLRPLLKPAVPEVRDSHWSNSSIDRFILAELEQRDLQPTKPADKHSLIRRATYDLTGLPPHPQEVADFVADESPKAFERVVERLLASEHYGQRWGRHWLDVVRYADTAGDNSDFPIPQNYRYRDWVIEAFNRDLPYDEFIRDQIAGDLRGGQNEQERQQRLIATGYLAGARRFGSRVDDYPWHLTIEDTIDNLGRAFLGASLSCARCHDHKFDPFTTRDYYGLYGILSSTRFPWPGIELDQRQRDLVLLAPTQQLAEMQQQISERQKKQRELDKQVRQLKEKLEQTAKDQQAAIKSEYEEAKRIAEEHGNQPAICQTAYAVAESATRNDATVQIKGDPTKPGDLVRRHFPAVLGGGALPEDCAESGRRELAEWIVAEENPLTARVMVNRIWLHHFGRGLVSSANDFGKQGKPPTHPQLLDYLAWTFRENGWSIKSLHREIMLSQVYQQSSHRERRALTVDPANDYLAGFRRQRLDAEAIRDTLLELAGDLDLSPAGPHPFPAEHQWNFTQHNPFKTIYPSNRRSIYLMTQRIQRHPFLAIFDGADPSASTAARSSSITPIQALFLMNDPLVHQQSERIATRVLQSSSELPRRVNFAYQLLFARPADAAETAAAEQFISKALTLLARADSRQLADESSAWNAYVRSLLRLNEFIYLD